MEKNFKLNFLSIFLIIILILIISSIAFLSAPELSAFFYGLKGEENPTFITNQQTENVWCASTLEKLIGLAIQNKAQTDENYRFEVTSLKKAALEVAENNGEINYKAFSAKEPLQILLVPSFEADIFIEHKNDEINNNRKKLCSLWYSANN